jgi:hypothetical protein
MSNYVKVTDFATKDGLPLGDPNKKVRGTEIDDEFEAIEAAVATKADLSSPTFTGTPTAPTAAASDDSTKLATTAHVKDAIESYMLGMIVMWSGSVASIPTGWRLCDGTNGTVDLRDKFVIGAGNGYAVGATGGAASVSSGSAGAHSHGGATGSHSLTLAEIPSHTHSNGSYALGYKADGNPVGAGWALDGTPQTTGAAGSGDAHSHTISTEAAHTHTVATLPPFYALAFIQKTAS